MDNNEQKKPEPEALQEEVVEGNIIDVEPEVEPPPSGNRESTEQKTGKSQLPLILAVIAIALVSATWIAGYRYWQNIVNDLSNMQDRISSTYKEQQALNTEIDKAKQVLQEQKAKIADQEQQAKVQSQQISKDKEQITRQAEVMQNAVDQVNAKIGRSSNQWQLAEAEYLMRIANHKLSLAQDVTTALTALQQADEKLRDSGDLGLISIREKLAAEISLLKAIKPVDITGMASTLQSMSQQAGQLKLAGAALTTSTATNNSDGEKPMGRSLDTLLSDGWKGFRELMVVRRHDQPVSAMLPPTQSYFLYENMRMQLEGARLALLRQESILFKSSLDTAIDWLNSFFNKEDRATQNMLATLNELKATDLKPAMPDISGSLNMLGSRLETGR